MATTMQPQPLYRPQLLYPAFELRYSWTGWPTRPFQMVADVLINILPLWEKDGIRLLERYWSDDKIQLTFSTTPDVSPIVVAGRAKGRLQYALRKSVPAFPGFSRKVSVRSVGHNCREDVETYIDSQVEKAKFVDPSFRDLIEAFTVVCKDADLSKPAESSHGRYWYNLHIVLVTTERYRIADRTRLAKLRDNSLKIAEKKGYKISRLSVMPDHIHIALRGNIQHSPQEIALAFQNNLAYALGQMKIWADTFYAGTFGEYDMWAIRRNESPR
jgi:REP element-mobilizing transposase RayT